MGLFSRSGKLKGEEQINIATAEDSISNADDAVCTSLVFHEESEFSKQERYVYQFHHQQLQSLKPNQISISGIRLSRFEEDILIMAFIRNTLKKAVRFELVDILLLDENEQVLAKKSFDLSEMGEIPGISCMPWSFMFEEEDIFVETISEKGWKIAFELKNEISQEHSLDLVPLWKEKFSASQLENLQNLVAGLPKLNEGEVNFMGLQAVFKENNQLAVTILIRNGSDKQIKIEKFPLIVEDADGDQVCQDSFVLDNFEVKPNTSKPWTFIFPSELVKKKSADLSRWKVYPPNPV